MIIIKKSKLIITQYIIIKSNLQSQTKLSTYNQKLDSSTSLLEKSRQTLAQTDALGR
jgi:hypothetical protein